MQTTSFSISPRSLFVAGIAMLAIAMTGAMAMYRQRQSSQAEMMNVLARLTARMDALEGSHRDRGSALPTQILRDLEEVRQTPLVSNGLTRTEGKGLLGETESTLAADPKIPLPEPQAIARELDALHAQDPADPNTGPDSAMRLEALAAEPALLKNKLIPTELQTDCRASRCRMVADFKRGGDAQDWATMLLTMSGGTLSYAKIVQIPKPDGSVQVRLYGARR